MRLKPILTAILLTAVLAGCSKKAESTADAAAPGAATAETSYPQPEPVADGPLACVVDVAPEAVCTMDLNLCGNSSQCACPAGYAYNGSIGKCVLGLNAASEGIKVDVPDGECVSSLSSTCTKDINICGHPSACNCEAGFGWNAAVGKCVSGLGLG